MVQIGQRRLRVIGCAGTDRRRWAQRMFRCVQQRHVQLLLVLLLLLLMTMKEMNECIDLISSLTKTYGRRRRVYFGAITAIRPLPAGEVGAAGAGAAVTVPFLKARCSSAPSRRNRWAERADASRDRC